MATQRTARPGWLAWDNYFVGVGGLVLGLCFGTCAALIAGPGRNLAAIILVVLAALCVLPALLRALAELSVWVRLAVLAVGFALLLPAILVSPDVRDWAAERWERAWK
ncbi:hypothetical protein [Nocardia caishijiensis]|uniref:Uncharacterized protein n=1 Tax=Nocardia caishijiensis TaxID=184756 RepID=A0ABQ6YJY8_9NOCA|nr:hypothetical protein [Nocardia caishijiensis]KAF0846112.1 hypothetical protein FNL39_10523 [Nocardia caishijiensis]